MVASCANGLAERLADASARYVQRRSMDANLKVTGVPDVTDTTHLDAALPAEHRARLLLEKMTLLEKAHQITGVFPWCIVSPDGSDATGVSDILTRPPGALSQLIADDAPRLVAQVGHIQRRFVERTRLGIPVLLHAEALNGLLAGGATSFPTPIGLAATWSPDLIGKVADIVRRQMLAVGLRHALSPVIDIALDARWGRFHETYGEDPYLVTQFGLAFVRDLQGEDPRDGVIATAKHFLGYSASERAINQSAVDIGPRRLRDLYAFPFEAAINVAGLRSVMNSYSEIDGVPVGASEEILNDLLRETLGFSGFVASDYSTTNKFVNRQQIAQTAGEAARLALSAGLDLELPMPFGYGDVLAEEVSAGRVPMEHLDRSVHRVLSAKFAAGLFEAPYPREVIELTSVMSEGDDLSLDLARKQVTLLANDGILPLARDSRRIAVIGPHADAPALQFATYTYPSWRQAVDASELGKASTMVGTENPHTQWYEGLDPAMDDDDRVRERFGTVGIGPALAALTDNVTVEPGCGLLGPLSDEAWARAIDAARGADLVVLALGGASLWFNGDRTEGEASDSADIALPPMQVALAEAIAALRVPVITVLVQGRAYSLPSAVLESSAIIASSYAGPHGPQAIAEVLIGAVEPSGKLPYSLARHSGQLPVYHHERMGSGFLNPVPPGIEHHYLDMSARPLFPFGHGLSYTEFALSALELDASTPTDGELHVKCTLENRGRRDGATVVQLYARHRMNGVTRPGQQLLGFARADLRAGQTAEIEFAVPATLLAASRTDHSIAVEAGSLELMVGFSAEDILLRGEVHVVGDAHVVTPATRSYSSQAHVNHR